jgi:hypothetical protein
LFSRVVVAGSQVPYRVTPEEAGRARFSWRAPPPRVEACRPPTEEELLGLPPHLRPEEVCEGRSLPFRLEVEIDGETALEREIRPSGARHDRPVYVRHELPLSPGAYRLVVRFEVADAEGTAAAAIEPLHLDVRVELGPRQVLLVTRTDQGLVLVP